MTLNLNKFIKASAVLLTALYIAIMLSSCSTKAVSPGKNTTNITDENSSKAQTAEPSTQKYSVSNGSKTYRGFSVDNVLHNKNDGDIHFNLYIPKAYDSSLSYALFVTLPGYEGLYFQGVGVNIKQENFAFEAQKYVDNMIIVAPQLNGWDEESADETIVLVEYLISEYSIDNSKVYIEGYSGGGETASIAVSKRPDLFSAYLQISSQWDGEYESVADARLPVYIAIGRDDEYYGSKKSQNAYDSLYNLYKKQGLADDEINKILIIDIKERDYFTSRNMSNEHAGGSLFAKDKTIMSWLFGEHQNIKI